jgi:hypothetical protein
MPANYPLGEADSDRVVFNLTTSMWERGVSTAAPTRLIFPVFDDSTAAPLLTYKAVQAAGAEIIFLQGENFTGITAVAIARDVKVGGNTGSAPVVSSILVTDARITVTLDCTLCTAEDYWGVRISDADGNLYGAPSPLRISDIG